jgi:hypothetical protein
MIGAFMRRFSKSAIELAAAILPRYCGGWRGFHARELPFAQRNDLLHTDAFPRRPTHGELILRIIL